MSSNAPPTAQQTVSLARLAKDINVHHRQCESAMKTGLEHAFKAGHLLIEAKVHCPHGTWAAWLAANFDGSHRTAQRYMMIANRWEELEAKATRVSDLPYRDAVQLLTRTETTTRANILTGNTEWYTPTDYIENARAVLGGIDLDPASSIIAQKTVRAKKFYTEQDDGLRHKWFGRVFLNPPYKMPLIQQFAERLCEEYQAGSIAQAVLLTNNATDTRWWQATARRAACVCFTEGRIRFYNRNGEGRAPTHGQTFFYFGDRVDRFCAEFGGIGWIVRTEQTAWPSPVVTSQAAHQDRTVR